MPRPLSPNEVESEMFVPGRRFVFVIGAFFLAVGIAGLVSVDRLAPRPAFPIWIAYAFAATFALFGVIPLGWSLKQWLRPPRVRHAGPDVLPDVAGEPVPREGSVVHGRLTHELVDDGQGGRQFRPAVQLERNDTRFILGFGIPFLSLFAGLLARKFHDDFDWAMAATLGIGATLLCGGTALVLIATLMRASYRRLGRLDIPAGGGDLQLDVPEEPNVDRADLAEGLRWAFVGDTKRQQLTIPREMVAAVQLCPWKFRTNSSTTWAVQGLLVLAPAADGRRHRLPLLLTSDYARAARLMHQLAQTLEVPFLFHADAAGWQAEEARSKTRPHLKCGGTQS